MAWTENKQKIAIVTVIVVIAGVLYSGEQGNASDSFVEKSSGVKFKSGVGGLDFLGTGIRVKKIGFVGVKVYAVAMYGESKKVFVKGKDPVDILKSTRSGRRLLRLVFVRDVGASAVVDALASVKNVDQETQERFRSTMLEAIAGPIKKTQSIELSCATNANSLTVGIRQAKPFSIQGKNLCNAVFQLFIGPSPVSPPLLTSIRESATSFLAPPSSSGR